MKNIFSNSFRNNFSSINNKNEATQMYSNSVRFFNIYVSNIKSSFSEVIEGLQNLGYDKSVGPDGVPHILINNCRYSLSKPIHHILNYLLSSGTFPNK